MGRRGRKKSTGKKNGKKEKNGNGGKNKAKVPKKTSKGSKKRSGGKMKFGMDIFNDEAMNDAYYTCHNIMDVLLCRGFPWPDAQKKKKKGKK